MVAPIAPSMIAMRVFEIFWSGCGWFVVIFPGAALAGHGRLTVIARSLIITVGVKRGWSFGLGGICPIKRGDVGPVAGPLVQPLCL